MDSWISFLIRADVALLSEPSVATRIGAYLVSVPINALATAGAAVRDCHDEEDLWDRYECISTCASSRSRAAHVAAESSPGLAALYHPREFLLLNKEDPDDPNTQSENEEAVAIDRFGGIETLKTQELPHPGRWRR